MPLTTKEGSSNSRNGSNQSAPTSRPKPFPKTNPNTTSNTNPNRIPTAEIPEKPNTNFPDPNKTIKLPRKPVLGVLRELYTKFTRFLFSSEFAVFRGFTIAISAVIFSSLGYYLVLNQITGLIGVSPVSIFGIQIPLIPIAMALTICLTIQWVEIEPRKHQIFPHLADEAAYKAGQERMVNPVETANTPSMLPTYKFMARFGDSIRSQKASKASDLCYVGESIAALVSIGYYLGSMNPFVQIGALLWGIYSVFGCEFGLAHAEEANASCLTATQRRDYRTLKAKLSSDLNT